MEDQGQYAKLFNEMDSQALITLGLILVSTILLIIVSQRGLNWVANRLHGQVRFRVFARCRSPPVDFDAALSIAVPIIIEPSLPIW